MALQNQNAALPHRSASERTVEILTAEEVSLQLRLPLSTVYYLAKTGALPAFQLGRSWRFSATEIQRLIRPKSAEQHILVVDDDAVTRLFVRELLSSRIRTVSEAATMEEALPVIERQRFDLIFVDFKLPGRSGMELIRQIRNDYSLNQIVVITAFADMAQADELFALGALTLLRKPLAAVQLIECAERVGALASPAEETSVKSARQK
jgi:excisionase family DNA binding protein